MFKEKTKPKLERYTDVTGQFSNRALKWGEWYLRHKFLLRKTLITVLVAWCTVSLGYGLGYFAYYFSYGYFEDQKMMVQQTMELENYRNLQPSYEAQDLQISNVSVYQSVGDLYDLMAYARNPNERFIASVVYRFEFGGGQTDLVQTVILPGDERPIAYFGLETERYPASPKLVIEDIQWRRVNPHQVLDVESYINERDNFQVENFDFSRASRSGGVPNHMIEFDIYNNTIYSFWDPSFYVELIRGNRTVGIVYLVIDEFKTKEIRHIDLRSYVKNLDVSNIKVYPVINVFDDGEYMSSS